MENTGNNDNSKKLEKNSDAYVSPAPDEKFPIIASSINYESAIQFEDTNSLDNNDLKNLSDCGFNMFISKGIEGNLFYILGAAKKYSTYLISTYNCIFSVANYCPDIENLIKLDPECGFGGFYVEDEPSLDALEGKEDPGDDLTFMQKYERVFKNFPGKFIYVNLLGIIYGSENPKLSLENYADKYIENFSPSYLSFDFYPITEKNNLIYAGTIYHKSDYSQEGELNIKYDDFYTALQVYSSRKNGNSSQLLPFWSYCESMCYMHLNTEAYRPVALESYLRFQIFTALAYGAKGTLYWTYSMRKNGFDEETQTYRSSYFSALLNRRNEKTAAWHFAKKINDEIIELNGVPKLHIDGTPRDIFKRGKEHRVIHLNNAQPYPSFEKILFSIQCTSPFGLIVSSFKVDTNKYFMFVSQDIQDYQTINFTTKNGRIREVTPLNSSGTSRPETLIPTTITCILIPGGYRIFQYSD